ncbi:conjugal transfer protein TraN [Francisellaceae bacterium]|nr:conjugal transfer protein TraN [Francisellaceae bacterium]
MIKHILILSLGFMIGTACANDTAVEYQKDQRIIAHSKTHVMDAANSFNPRQSLPQYNPNPSQTKYYQGVDQYSSDMTQQGESVLNNDPAGNTVYQAFAARPQIKINTTSSAIQDSKLIEDDSYNITHGISDQYVNCSKKPTNCTTSYENKTCITGHPSSLSCTTTLSVHMEDEVYWVDRTIPLTLGNVHFDGTSNALINMPNKEGIIKSIGFHVRNGGDPWGCHRPYNAYLNHVHLGTFVGNCGGSLGDLDYRLSNTSIQYTDKKSVLTLKEGGWSGLITGSMLVHEKLLRKSPVLVWTSGCPNIPETCHEKSQQCTEAGATKIIDGIAVTEPCWQKKTDYQCGEPESSSCIGLQEKGCQQLGSVCTDKSCSQYQDTYSCPVKKCAMQLVCAKDVFCIDGDCVKKTPTKNTHFGQDASELAAAAAAAKDFNKQDQVSLFNGQRMDCSVAALGFNDCCDDSGWGKNIHLGSCSDAEKKLGDDKEKYLVTYVGEYCSHRLPVVGTCTAHKRVYCDYSSRMARIVNDYGRSQIGKSYGSAENADCSGFTIDQFQKLDFNTIDFIDPIYIYNNFRSPKEANKKAGIAGDMNVNSPSQGAMNDEINKRIHDDLDHQASSSPALNSSIKRLKSEIIYQTKGDAQ